MISFPIVLFFFPHLHVSVAPHLFIYFFYQTR